MFQLVIPAPCRGPYHHLGVFIMNFEQYYSLLLLLVLLILAICNALRDLVTFAQFIKHL